MEEENDFEYEIPAASIDDVNLEKIKKTHPAAAKEIAKIGELLNKGEERQDDLLHLGRLLYEVGEVGESEYLLRRNSVEENDVVHQLYLKLHGTTSQDYFMHSIAHFTSQFGVQLTQEQRNDFLCHTYQSIPISVSQNAYPELYEMLCGTCEVSFMYAERHQITADVISTSPERQHPKDFPEAEYAFPLVYQDGQWIHDEDMQKR